MAGHACEFVVPSKTPFGMALRKERRSRLFEDQSMVMILT